MKIESEATKRGRCGERRVALRRSSPTFRAVNMRRTLFFLAAAMMGGPMAWAARAPEVTGPRSGKWLSMMAVNDGCQ